jgi:hypothetical protein
MTLAQLQEIGREVGISPALIQEAAHAVDQSPRPARTFFGLPTGVERIVDLGRKLTDDEWERFVVDLRETFDARGTLRQEGSLRSWNNGNLQALLEPTATGHRIRLRTVKGDARAMLGGGAGMLGMAATMLTAALVTGVNDTGLYAAIGFVATMGAGMFGSTVLRLPNWAKTRRQQMDELAARLALVAISPPSET